MTVMEAQESPLFNNIKLQWKLPVESIQIVFEELRKKGTSGGWIRLSPRGGGQKNGGNSFTSGFPGVARITVFTLYDLTTGEDTEDEEFYGLDEATLLRAPLQALQQEHKAEIITVSDGLGVKFF